MALGAHDDRTEPATPKRREEARERGEVLKSRELSSALTLSAVALALWYLGPSIWEGLALELKTYLERMARAELQSTDIRALVAGVLVGQFSLIAPVLGVALAVGVLGNALQVGGLFTSTPLLPRWSRLNPWAGLGRLVSVQSWLELGKAMSKLLILAAVAFFSLRSDVDTLFVLGEAGVGPFFAGVAETAARLLGRSGLALLVLGGLDYLLQYWQYERGLRMTKDEVKEEAKQREVDPKIRARIRSMQREFSRQRMMAAVPQATVVITNPRHLAVALLYERGSMPAPQVVAKGAGYLAEGIKTLAREAGVPIVEDIPTARMLYRHVPVGAFVPVTLYKTMAQILAYVYSLRGIA